MNVAVLVPRRVDHGRRDELWSWVKDYWSSQLPNWPIHEGHHDDGPFNRSLALNRAAAAAGDWDIAVVIDSDIFVDRDHVLEGVKRARTGWITFPFHEYRYLSRQMTEKIMGGYRGNWHPGVEFTLTNTCSSCVIVPRPLWDEVGGFDEGFEGWGFEDVAFSLACQALAGGMHRVEGDVWHLHHQPSTENSHQSPQWIANRERMLRYGDCDYNAEKMRSLLDELA